MSNPLMPFVREVARSIAPYAAASLATTVGIYLASRNSTAVAIAQPAIDAVLLAGSKEDATTFTNLGPKEDPTLADAARTIFEDLTGVATRSYVPKHIKGIVDVTDTDVIDLLAKGLISDLTEIGSNDSFPKVLFDSNLVRNVETQLNLSSKNRVILSGSSQAGKTTLIGHIVMRILNGEALGTLSHTEKRGDAPLGRRVFQVKKLEPVILEVLSRTMGEKCLLVIDEAQDILLPENLATRIKLPGLNCGMTVELKNRTSRTRAQGALPPILAASNEASFILSDPALANRIQQINVPPRSAKSQYESLVIQTPSLIKNYLALYKQLDNLTIDPEALAPIAYLVPQYAKNRRAANALINFLDRLVLSEYLKCQVQGLETAKITEEQVYKLLHDESGKSIAILKAKLKQQADEDEGFPIPYELSSCLKDMTVDPENISTLSIGRNKQIEEVLRILMQDRTNNLVVEGPAGVGKTNMVKTLAYLLYLSRSKGEKTEEEKALLDSVQIPENLVNARILELDLTKLLKEDDAVRLVSVLLENINESGKHLILFVDEFQLLVRNEALFEAIKSKITSEGPTSSGRLTLIGATNMSGVMNSKRVDDAFGRRFETVMLAAPTFSEMQKITERKYPDTVVIPEVRDCVLQLKDKLRPKFSEPDASLFLLEGLKSWYYMKRRREKMEEEPIKLEHLQEYLAENYHEKWGDYWAPLLGMAPPVAKVIEKRLSYFDWACFKVQTLFNRVFRGKWLDYPTDTISVHVPIPTKMPTSRKPSVEPEKTCEDQATNLVKDKVKELSSSPLAGFLKMATGFDINDIAQDL